MSILDEMVVELGIGRGDLARLIQTAPKRYKVYTIPKRHGAGVRVIAQPSSELKILQRFLLDRTLSSFPVHPAATAYAPGSSIKKNARAHKKSRSILKLDFENFFPSIRVIDWVNFAKSNPGGVVPAEDIAVYSKILFWGQSTLSPRCLSIGAPTSPALSNILMYPLDESLTALARQLDVTYTRYADDITVSGRELESLLAFERQCKRIVKECRHPRLKFNAGKRGVYTRGQRRMVTGLILTPDGNVSIGRERKRLISSLLHRAKLGQADMNQLATLKGLLAFSLSAERTFITRMRDKYGDAVVDEVLAARVPSRKVRAAQNRIE